MKLDETVVTVWGEIDPDIHADRLDDLSDYLSDALEALREAVKAKFPEVTSVEVNAR